MLRPVQVLTPHSIGVRCPHTFSQVLPAAAGSAAPSRVHNQINDRFNASYQKQVWSGLTLELSYFYNLGARVPYSVNLNMADPAFRYEQKTLHNAQVDNPFFGYLTPDRFPARCATIVR